MLRRNGVRRRHKNPLVLTAVIHKEGRWYVAQCPEVGTVSQGKTVEGALTNLREATELYLEEFPIKKIVRSLMTTFEAAYA
ncbi:MAG: type II toxin-antitoxin system HicB family antitoxin [Chloroflexi bacterium]|nr:type II toxin-antitoxin system HicB family antitoxin [Chloroflexota bacterium]MBI5080910.1 type II toxin-antitoxin system HicB family antitoxin [Chloroflexota bacterium]